MVEKPSLLTEIFCRSLGVCAYGTVSVASGMAIVKSDLQA
jgi:hypothetical protein